MKGKKVTKKDSKMLSPGERLKKLRTDAGLTQEELAELIDNLPENNRTGRSRNQISYIENGSRSISADYAKLLSKVLHVLPEYLLGESNFRTLKEKRDALAEKDWEEKILTPIEIDSLVSKILEKMGYTEFEDDITGKEFFTGDFEIPAGYTRHQNIPDEDIRKSFDNTYRHIRPQVYRGIKCESDGKAKYILDSKINAMFSDIESYIKYRIEREFR